MMVFSRGGVILSEVPRCYGGTGAHLHMNTLADGCRHTLIFAGEYSYTNTLADGYRHRCILHTLVNGCREPCIYKHFGSWLQEDIDI